MKQSLTQNISQHIAMTPALRQGIELLNLPSQEIETKIQEILDSNIMLEEEEVPSEQEPTTLSEKENNIIQEEQIIVGEPGMAEQVTEVSDLESERSAMITDEVPDASDDEVYFEDWSPGSLDVNRDRQFDNPLGSLGSSSVKDNDAQFFSLRQYLLGQLDLVNEPYEGKAISIALIDFLNEDGFLHVPFEEIVEALKGGDDAIFSEMESLENITVSDVEAVLKRVIQNFEPTGVGARSVQECLILQLSALEDSDPLKEKALLCCSKFLDLLGKKEFEKLKGILNVCDEEFRKLVDLIRSLNPRPGSAYANHNTQYIVPDVYVFKANGIWQVESNTSLCPALRINALYESLANKATTDSEKKTMQKHLSEAKFFIKSLRLRNDTILRVARAIVSRQTDFFEEGESRMKPMILKDIAPEVGRDQSNVSRATSGKYMDTPRGVFEFKYFFNSHVNAKAGEDVSSLAIQSYMQKIIADESETSPYSDQKISNLLAEKGFKVARRTVTKYRESLSIPSSSQRKQSIVL